MNAPLPVPPRRCAVYCRVSSDERLDQSFNSIDAQKEAGHAFIKSQGHEGWIAVTDDYDDGGYSGGNMERPALRRLMADFARMVDVFDRHRVSFSAVTQQINSATSMGRLMLNVLLSFAQFEREVTSERIRDKIAASKAKGMWMGGPLPLGYDVRDRMLVVNETEAALVRRIFTDFVAMRSATLMVKAYVTEGVVTKRGKSFTKQTIYKMLNNRVYLGEIVHKGQSFTGQHPAIITPAQWDAVHALIATDGVERRRETHARMREPVLLRGLLFTPDGERLVPSYTVKRDKTYRYYTPVKHRRFGSWASQHGSLPAGPIEALVVEQIIAALSAPHVVQSVWGNPPGDVRSRGGAAHAPAGHDVAAVVPRGAVPAGATAHRAGGDRRRRPGGLLAGSGLAGIGGRVGARNHRCRVAGTGGNPVKPRITATGAPIARERQDGGEIKLSTFIPLKIRKRGTRQVVRPDGDVTAQAKADTQHDAPLMVALTRAFYWQQLLDDSVLGSGSEIAKREGLHHSTVNELLRLTLLEPAIIQTILAGKQPRCMSLLWFQHNPLPRDWTAQREVLAGFDA